MFVGYIAGLVSGYLIAYYYSVKIDAFITWVKEKYASLRK